MQKEECRVGVQIQTGRTQQELNTLGEPPATCGFIAQARIPPGHVFTSVDSKICKVYRPEGLFVCWFVGMWGCGSAGLNQQIEKHIKTESKGTNKHQKQPKRSQKAQRDQHGFGMAPKVSQKHKSGANGTKIELKGSQNLAKGTNIHFLC